MGSDFVRSFLTANNLVDHIGLDETTGHAVEALLFNDACSILAQCVWGLRGGGFPSSLLR